MAKEIHIDIKKDWIVVYCNDEKYNIHKAKPLCIVHISNNDDELELNTHLRKTSMVAFDFDVTSHIFKQKLSGIDKMTVEQFITKYPTTVRCK